MLYTWTGLAGDSNFQTPANWAPVGVPGSADDASILIPANVELTSSTTLNSLTTSIVASLTVLNNQSLEFLNAATPANPSGDTVNAGRIVLDSTGNGTALQLSASMTLTGGGTVLLSDNSQNFVDGTGTLDNTNNVVEGAGTIGNGSNAGFVLANAGTINAFDTVALNLESGGGTYTNTGLMEDTSSGGLELSVAVLENASGTILATGTGDHVDLFSTDIVGGTLTTSGAGVITAADGGSSLDGVDVSAASSVVVTNNDVLTLVDTITNQGTIALASSGNGTELRIETPAVTLTGTGDIHLGDSTQNDILGTGTLDDVNNVIDGAGQIGNASNAGLQIINASTIDADDPDAALVVTLGGGTITNDGTLEATATAAGNGGLVL